MKFVVGENGRNPAKNLPRSSFVHHETHMEGPRREIGTLAVGGERLTACATRPPNTVNLFQISRILGIKREKVCAVCPYLFFIDIVVILQCTNSVTCRIGFRMYTYVEGLIGK